MEADFSGYATKAGLKCADGRTIMAHAFRDQDKQKVPLVWQHGHNDPENVLGHVILENRDDGVYAYGFLNDSAKAEHARKALEHEDITQMSIWANNLVERSKKVLHGAIREVSLVLSGANPGALIDNITLRHGEYDDEPLDDEAIITTGFSFDEVNIDHAEGDGEEDDEDDDGPTVEDIYNSMTEEQQEVVHYLVGEALESSSVEQSNLGHSEISEDSTVKEVYESLTDIQKKAVNILIEDAAKEGGTLEQSNINDDQKGNEMKHNVFEDQGGSAETPHISHDDMQSIVADATRKGSLKDAVEDYALQHGIEQIDTLFPDAQNVTNTPEWLARRNEWVAKVFGGASKSPFSRIRTLWADLTMEEARAKGYVTGAMKKEEFFPVAKRETTPTTIYKKQALDRDDMVDITDFDVVAWLKGEMRIMLDEEIARAMLLGDGRDVAHEDKINEQNIRPIVSDHELYTITVNVNLDDTDSTVQEIIDAIVTNRRHMRGSGQPTFFTTESVIAQFLLLKDSLGRRIYTSLSEIATELRVSEIVGVEPMEEYDDIVGVLVNMSDYRVGADAGGSVGMFDDFDIDYNKYKYLIETRMSGALTKLKSAMVIKKVAASDTLVTPDEPGFNSSTGVVTIPTVTGVEYYDSTDMGTELTAGAQSAIAAGESVTIVAVAASGYYFTSSEDDTWTFTRES